MALHGMVMGTVLLLKTRHKVYTHTCAILWISYLFIHDHNKVTACLGIPEFRVEQKEKQKMCSC